TLTFASLPAKTYGDAALVLNASASNGDAVIYTSNNTQVAQIVDGKLLIIGAGQAIITASLSENPNYQAVAPISHTFTVAKAKQTLTLEGPSSALGEVGTVNLTSSSTSGLAVTLQVDDPMVATLEGQALKIHRLG